MMFRSIVLIFALSHQALAGPSKPEITIGINSAALDKGALAALEPAIQWSTSGTIQGYDVDGGVDMKVVDKDNMPYGLWGRVKKTVGGIALSAKVDTRSDKMSNLGLDLQASSGSSGTSLQVTGNADVDSLNLSVGTIKVSQKIETEIGKFTVTPKYNVGSGKADVKLVYGRDDTVITLDADLDKQKLTVSQAIGDANVITPSITSDGEVELEYSRSIGTGSLTAGYKPDSYVGLKFEDGPLVASIRCGVEGYYKPEGNPVFSVRRKVDVTGF